MGTLSNDVGELRFPDPRVIHASARGPGRRDRARWPIARNLGRRRKLTRESAVQSAPVLDVATSDIGNVATT